TFHARVAFVYFNPSSFYVFITLSLHDALPISLNIVLTEGKGAYVKDSEGNTYIDCVSGFSVLNQGHCHPKIIQAFLEQSQKITMTSRALYSDNLGVWEEKVC